MCLVLVEYFVTVLIHAIRARELVNEFHKLSTRITREALG